MTGATAKPGPALSTPAAAARTRLLLERPIMPTLMRLTANSGMLGATSLAAFGAAVRLEYLLYPPSTSASAPPWSRWSAPMSVPASSPAPPASRGSRSGFRPVMAMVGVLAIASPSVWMRLFTDEPAIQRAAAPYLAIMGVAHPCVAGNVLMSAFQVTRQPQWPLAAMSCRLLVVVAGGWIAIETLGAGLPGLAVVTALGLDTWAIIQVLNFRFFVNLK